jgi:hypothetical protein
VLRANASKALGTTIGRLRMYEVCLWRYTPHDKMLIQEANKQFIEGCGHRPNHKRMLFHDGTLFLELRYHPGEESMESGEGEYYQMKVALDIMGHLSKVNDCRWCDNGKLYEQFDNEGLPYYRCATCGGWQPTAS